ncbi:MAG TPA: serine hydrolase, partial [Chryseolinea sp.]|nr:serine hydrolase [Chryseolinea sp.]
MRFAFILFLTLIAFSLPAQSPLTLSRSTPETEGVSSKALIAFLDAAANSKHEFHSIMVLRHGKVIAEGWWNPYRPDLKHTLYSCSKSFTASAVGFAVSEKKLSVEDQVISFFPDDVPSNPSENLKALRVKHLLSMSVGHDKDPTGATRGSDNWIRSFLEVPVVHEPGTKFVYNSLATYMLSAIVQKVTGQTILEYLKPRLFAPLNITGMDWETDPDGINTGGWGLRLRTEDMAKFGQMFLQKGKWNGRQILPETWIADASTAKIMQDPDAPQARKDSSDWLQGYGYQMWRSRHNSYRGDGAYGQFILVLPEQDAVIAITAETADMQREL